MKLLVAVFLLCVLGHCTAEKDTTSTAQPMTSPQSTAPSNTSTVPPSTTASSSTTLAPSTTVTPVTTTVSPNTTLPPSTSAAPNTTVVPVTTPVPTGAPTPEGGFDTLSFIGGIILSVGVMVISFVGFKFYKARTERNYHTL